MSEVERVCPDLSMEQHAFFAESLARDSSGKLLMMFPGPSPLSTLFYIQNARFQGMNAYCSGYCFSSIATSISNVSSQYAYYLNICAPAPILIVLETLQAIRSQWMRSGSSYQVFHPEAYTVQDELRCRLQTKGYDGIIYGDVRKLDVQGGIAAICFTANQFRSVKNRHPAHFMY